MPTSADDADRGGGGDDPKGQFADVFPFHHIMLVRLPTIPHRECLIVSGPSEILLSNARSALSINKSGAPVRGLRSKSRPLVVGPELAIPSFFRDRFVPMFHFASA